MIGLKHAIADGGANGVRPPCLREPDDAALGTVEDFVAPIGVIRRTVARFFAVSESALLAPGRRADLTVPRHVAFWLAREMTTASLPAIARAFKRDHSTVLHGIRRIEAMRERQPAARLITDHLVAVLKGEP